MTPRRPYVLRAFYDWLVDNELTPHLVVEADMPGVRVPEQFVQNGQIILNVAPRAVGHLEMGNEAVTFSARFGGKPHSVIVPLYAIQAIYARENGAGTMFEPEDAYIAYMEGDTDAEMFDIAEEKAPVLGLAESSRDEAEEDSPNDEPPKVKGRPSLRVVK